MFGSCHCPVLALLLCAAAARAQTNGAPAPLTLRAALASALQANLGLAIARIDPAVARENMETADSRFDPTLTLHAENSEQRDSATDSELDGSEQPTADSRLVRAGISKTFGPGTTVGLDAGTTRSGTDSSFSTLNPAYGVSAGVGLTQPLLKGAGTASGMAASRLGRLAVSSADLTLRGSVLDLVESVQGAYWRAVAADEQLRVRTTSLALASNLLDEARARAEVGLATRMDVLQAEAEASSREGDRVAAVQTLEDARDALARLLGIRPPGTAIPGDALPAAPETGVPVEEAWRRALADNPDYRRRQLEASATQITVAQTRQDRWPALDLQARSGISGLDADVDQARQAAQQGDGYFWSAGITLTAPWGGREGEAAYARARLQHNRAQLAVDDFEQQLHYTLLAANRALTASGTRLGTAQLTHRLRAEESEQEHARYDDGIVSLRDVLTAQSRLADAQLAEVNARVDHLAAGARLGRLQGSLLERHGLSWSDTDLEERQP